MSSALRAYVLLFACLLSLQKTGIAQDSLSFSKKAQKLFLHTFSKYSFSTPTDSSSHFNLDSLSRQKLKQAIRLPDTTSLTKWFKSFNKPAITFPSKPLLQIGKGYISYNWNYRSGIDTPIVEKNISQHLITGSVNVLVAQKLPVRVTYFERRSNSGVFRDFRDFRVELSTQEFQRLQADRFRKQMTGFTDKLRDPLTRPAMEASLKKITDIDSWLSYATIRKKIIDSKELLISPDLLDTLSTGKKDSLLTDAKEFIALYEKMELQKKKYGNLYDSLHQEYVSAERRIKQFQQLLNGNLNNPDNIHALEEMAQKYGGDDRRIKRLGAALSSIRKLAVGKTTPNFSNLTLKNTNVRGLDFEYNRNNFYLAVAAGSVDFRVRDFVYNKQRRVPQFVYAGRIGYGRKDGNNIILSYYEGKKQLYAGVSGTRSYFIKGVSLASQLVIEKNHRLNIEYAQSAAPPVINTAARQEKASFDFKDRNNQAYSIQLKSTIPATHTRFEGMFQHSGVNFQNFTNYRINAAANSWSAKLEQYLWKKNLQVVAALRKNDFSNPLILQRYNANTVFKNFTATFRKRNWPTIMAGYMPSSQYTVVDSIVYENHYQILNGSINHRYRLGTAEASSAFMYNRFYNNSQDTGFVYYNANNFFFNQSFRFTLYTANISIAHTENGTYKLDVWDAGFLFNVTKQNSVGFGFKINHINTDTTSHVGLYGNARVQIPKVGQLNIWIEKNYLPTMRHQLIRNEFYNIGFTRYFD